MKRTIVFALLLAILGWHMVFAQNPSSKPGVVTPATAQNSAVELPRFDLDFPGGTPQELVEAIKEQIPGGTLNVIIPVEHKNVRIPPLKMRQVNVAQLFFGISQASMHNVAFQTGFSEVPFGGAKSQRRVQIQERSVNYGFRFDSGTLTPETVWYFYNQDTPENFTTQKICHFYLLEPYLQKYKVEDITTAIQAGWKMLGQKDVPELNYHEDTKLLIAVGREAMLDIIDSVLAQLTISAETSSRKAAEAEKKQP